jgi:hypothetical protein
MEYTAGFIGGALWAAFGYTVLFLWTFCRWGEVLSVKNRDIKSLKQKSRGAVGILRDRDGRVAQ